MATQARTRALLHLEALQLAIGAFRRENGSLWWALQVWGVSEETMKDAYQRSRPRRGERRSVLRIACEMADLLTDGSQPSGAALRRHHEARERSARAEYAGRPGPHAYDTQHVSPHVGTKKESGMPTKQCNFRLDVTLIGNLAKYAERKEKALRAVSATATYGVSDAVRDLLTEGLARESGVRAPKGKR